jgi:tripartite-type tricarboxylate transporter receptor subunit TctC
MAITRRSVLRSALAAPALVGFAQGAYAAGYPASTVTILVPYAPGGASDIVARVVADQLRQSLKQNFIVENKPGAFGILAIQELARAQPDGYTLMIGNVSTNAITPILFPTKMGIDYAKTVIPVTELANLPSYLLGTTTNFPPRTVPELIAYCKARPGKISFASAGIGSTEQFDMVLFAKKHGLDLVHIPEKGGATDIVDSMATGDVQLVFLNVAAAAGMIAAGRLRPYAIATAQRSAEYPDVPTMTELGDPGIGTTQWQALFAHAGTPQPVLDTLYTASVAALGSPKAQSILKAATFSVAVNKSPADAATWLRGEDANWRKIVDITKIHMD